MSRTAARKRAPASDRIKFDFSADEEQQTVTIAITKGGEFYGTCHLTPDEAAKMAKMLSATREQALGADAMSTRWERDQDCGKV